VSYGLLMTLTVIEVVLLVAVLAGYLVALTRRLDSVASSLAKVAWGVRAVETELGSIGPSVRRINGTLAELTEDVLPSVAAEAERLAG
jgi:hypothetical protein